MNKETFKRDIYNLMKNLEDVDFDTHETVDIIISTLSEIILEMIFEFAKEDYRFITVESLTERIKEEAKLCIEYEKLKKGAH